MRLAAAGLALLLMAPPAVAQDLRGHGGPVRALVVLGPMVLSGGFDARVIRWQDQRAAQVGLGHTGAITALTVLPDGRFASGGQDGKLVIWTNGPDPHSTEQRHQAPVSGLVPVAGGVASAGWDGQIALPGRPAFAAHQGQVSGLIAWPPTAQGAPKVDGLISAGTDLKLRFWQGDRLLRSVDLAAPPATLLSDATAVFVAGMDGTLRRYLPDQPPGTRALSDRPLPIIALAQHNGLIAAASVMGEVWILRASDLRLERKLETKQGAVWALAFDGDSLLTGGHDGVIRRWRVADGQALGAPVAATTASTDADPGARVWRACAVCHSMKPGDHDRAGPSLHGIFGRKIGSAPGYAYSAALRQGSLIWTPETVMRLFELGPEVYTPGSRMPDQKLTDPADRAALIAWLRANGGEATVKP